MVGAKKVRESTFSQGSARVEADGVNTDLTDEDKNLRYELYARTHRLQIHRASELAFFHLGDRFVEPLQRDACLYTAQHQSDFHCALPVPHGNAAMICAAQYWTVNAFLLEQNPLGQGAS